MRVRVWDASAVLKLIVSEPGSDRALDLFSEPTHHGCPDLMPVEVANALWKRCIRGDTRPDAVMTALGALDRLDLELVTTTDLLASAVRLAVDSAHPVYDCVYLALACAHHASLATADARLRSLAERMEVPVDWLGPVA